MMLIFVEMEPGYVVLIVVLSIILIAAILIPIFCCKKESNKQKGGGIILKDDNTKTSFGFNENILPLIDKRIINNDIVKRYMTAYTDFVTKNITDDTKKDFKTNIPILIETFSLYNRFNIIYSDIFKNKLRELRELYFDICVGRTVYNYFNMIKGFSQIKSEKTMKTKIKEICEDDDCPIYHNDNILSEDNYNKILEIYAKIDENKFNKNDWNEFRTIFTDFINNFIMNKSKAIISTDFNEDFKKQYEKIIGYTSEQYIADINKLFISNQSRANINFIKKGNLLQTIDKDYRLGREFDSSSASMFARGDLLREWYNNSDFKQFSTKIMVEGYDDLNDNSKFDHGDVIPAHISNIYTQSLILIYCHFECHNENLLFKILLATKLNISFVNILANILEPKKFNEALSDTFIMESLENH